jgi:hypothetical protein
MQTVKYYRKMDVKFSDKLIGYLSHLIVKNTTFVIQQFM